MIFTLTEKCKNTRPLKLTGEKHFFPCSNPRITLIIVSTKTAFIVVGTETPPYMPLYTKNSPFLGVPLKNDVFKNDNNPRFCIQLSKKKKVFLSNPEKSRFRPNPQKRRFFLVTLKKDKSSCIWQSVRQEKAWTWENALFASERWKKVIFGSKPMLLVIKFPKNHVLFRSPIDSTTPPYTLEINHHHLTRLHHSNRTTRYQR